MTLEEVIAKSSIPGSHGVNPFRQHPHNHHNTFVAWDQISDDDKCSICKEFAKTTPYFVSDVENQEWKEPVIAYDGEEYPIHL